MTLDPKALTRPIIGIENRTPQEAFDIMCDRITAALAALPQAEPAWPLKTLDQVEALARECGWNNRRYMTSADYIIWCDQMRKFARLASPTPAVSREVTPEAIVAALKATEFHRSQIQGFFAEKAQVHYIRDCTKANDQQIWSECGADYDAIHARMMDRIELERWRLVAAALSKPHSEK